MWNARRQSSTSAVAAGAIILSATGRSPTCGKQLRQHHGPLPVRRNASARASPQHDSVAWNQDAQLSHTTPNSTTCARGSNGCGLHRRGHCRRSAHFFANWAHARLGGTLAASPHRFSRLRKRAWPEICKKRGRHAQDNRERTKTCQYFGFRTLYFGFRTPEVAVLSLRGLHNQGGPRSGLPGLAAQNYRASRKARSTVSGFAPRSLAGHALAAPQLSERAHAAHDAAGGTAATLITGPA